MITKKQLINRVVDSGIVCAFIAAFFLDLTGHDFHRWPGIFLGGFALYQLALHAGWVKAVANRFFPQASTRMRSDDHLDADVLWVFIAIIVTGMLISGWLSLGLDSYSVWCNLYIWISVISLLALVIKIGLHWRWMISTLVRAMTHSVAAIPAAPIPAAALSGTAMTNTAPLTHNQRCPKRRSCVFPGSCRRYTDSSNNGHCDLGECV